MNVLVDIGHPKHVHVFKNVICELEKRGHSVRIVAKNKEVVFELLDAYNLTFDSTGEYKNNLVSKILHFPIINAKLLNIAREFKPDIFISKGSPYSAQISSLIGKPHIAFKDTEHANLTDRLTIPFTDIVCTPNCFQKTIKTKHIKFNGYYELAYLHEKYFEPDYDVIEKIGVADLHNLIIVRSVSWNATHDIQDKGFRDLKTVVNTLDDYGQVLISSEQKLEKSLEKYRIKLHPMDMHDLLYFAKLYFGESPTMATESAVLGTPAIFVSTSRRCYTDELQEKYGLVYNFSDPVHGQARALDKAVELLSDKNVKQEWARRRDVMLSEKIDVTAFMVDLIDGYPDSFYEVLEKYDCSYSSA